MAIPRKALLLGGFVIVVAAIVVTLVLVMDESPAGPTAATTTTLPSDGDEVDLSSPENAARSFAEAVEAGDGEAIADLTCVADDKCVNEYSEGAGPEELAEARDKIVEGADELATQLAGAKFGTVSDGPRPGMKEVDYRTPAMANGESAYLIFAEFDGTWLYMGGGANPTG